MVNLRARQIRRGFNDGAEDKPAVGAGASHQTEAIIAAGLKPKEMTKQERQVFGNRINDYLRARDKLLLSWWQDCKHAVNLRQLLDSTEDSSLAITRDAFYFLQENGYINFGVLPADQQDAGEPAAAADAAAAAAANGDQAPAEEPVEDEKSIVFKLYELLRVADMQTTSEKAIRKELQKHFKTDISEMKLLVKKHVNYFVAHLEEKGTLEPLGYEGQADPAASAAAAKAKARKAAAAAAAAAAARTAAAVPPPKPSGRVIVVGAGPAGLAAATLLKRNNVDVLVLEARDRVGGRVHSFQGPFSAPVDLGASLVTGTAPDAAEGLAPDPVSFICKQMGIQLHQLQGVLPIYDAAGQQVTQEVDTLVDRLRDDLLDAAHEQADEDEVAAQQQSLGAALQQALEQRMKPPPAPAAAAGDAAAAAGDTTANHSDENQQHPADGQQQQLDVKQETQERPEQKQEGEEQQQQQQQPEATAGKEQQDPDKQQPDEPKAEAADIEQPAETAPAAAAEPAAAAPAPYTPGMLELLDWHWANLEYGCSASLAEVSLTHWNQDEEWGGFGGPHAMVVGGFGQAMTGLAGQLADTPRLACPVSKIEYSSEAEQPDAVDQGPDSGQAGQAAGVRVTTAHGEVLEASLVLVTLPLGVLKQGGVEFVPALPEWKAQAVQRMGFGDLNKVVLEFPSVFWDDVDYFGITQPGGPDSRGRCFMFWNLARFNDGVPLLTSLVSGSSARAAEGASAEEMQDHVLQALRRVYGDKVLQPVACHVTKWASDEYSRGSYSYVAVGCSGAEYDSLALPVARRLLFAGEHTCKEHPDTVGGAMLSGMREAARALHLLRGPDADSAAAMVGSRTQTLSRADKRKRLEEAAAGESAEESEGRRKRRKKEKHKEKKQKKEKKEKHKHKDKPAGSDAEGSGGEDKAQGGGGRRGRGERRPAAQASDMASRAAAREHFRQDITRLWRGLLDAQQGDMGVVNEVLANCDSLDARQQCMAAIMRASGEALQHLSQDHVFLSTLHSWLSELVVERSDANLHVLKKVLELLGKLNSSWAALAGSGLMDSIKSAAEHRHREVQLLAVPIRQAWLAKNPAKPKPGVKQAPAAAAARKPAVLQQTQQQQQQRLSSAGGAPPAAAAAPAAAAVGAADGPAVVVAAAGDAATGGAAAVAAADLVEMLDPDERQELEATQAAVRAAQEQAEAAAAQLAALQEQLPVLPVSGRVRIDSFGEYKRVAKRQQQDAEDEEELEQQAAAKRQKQQHKAASGSQGRSAAAAPAAADEPSDPKERATKELREFVKVQLKPRFSSKQLTSEDCKWLLGKVTDKVLANTTALDMGKAGPFVTGKREKKVMGLIDSYVAKRKADKQAPAAGKADG